MASADKGLEEIQEGELSRCLGEVLKTFAPCVGQNLDGSARLITFFLSLQDKSSPTMTRLSTPSIP
jgi:hypothetical protein